MVKIDRRKKYIMVVDVETACGFDNPMVYDIGVAITDKKGNIYEERSFAIDEVINNQKLMNTAYYKEKLPQYRKKISNGDMQVVKFAQARGEMLALLEQYGVSQISAYNLQFDMNALGNTSRKLGVSNKFLTKAEIGIELKDIWSFACETIYLQATFQKLAVKMGWVSEAGNLRTSAEIGYRYITGNPDFIEEHTGLEDVRIECQILAHCYKQRKKHKSGILPHPWRIPNSKKLKEKRQGK